ncbi:MAG: Holliday junction branch migration protein RuvA [Minwuia sp.]|nr:Holliday junction branch migration protein RuvA [Minwuia sp.]
MGGTGMIARLKGRVDRLADEHVIIDVNGVGYLVFCSGRTLQQLGNIGDPAVLEIETHVREDHFHLYGFAELAERDMFLLLQTVQGVGAKVALAILSALSVAEIQAAIATGDVALLTRPAGVGKRLAQRLASELKEKMGGIAPTAGAPVIAMTGPVEAAADAVSALVNLGYRKAEAEVAVRRAKASVGEGADATTLITAGLKALAS